MKNIIFALMMLAVFTSCTKSQDINIKNWSAVKYYYTRGPLPPPYHYSFEITINNGGSSMLNYYLGYDNNNTPLIYNFTVSPDDLKILEERICDSKLATGKVESLAENEHPIGGPLNRVKLIITDPNPDLDQPPKVIESPYFPKEKFKKDLQELYDFIQKLVPGDVWLDVGGKTTEYESNYKK